MHRYSVYGLTIESYISLDLPSSRGDPDVVIRPGCLSHVGPPLAWESGSPFAGGSAQTWTLRVPGLFAAEVRQGREIVVDSGPEVDPHIVGVFATQSMLAYVLMQRGQLLLHASCVDIDGRAVAFAGFSGQGKSTLAAALVTRGHALLCDDVTALLADHRVLPGIARLKLWPDAAAALGHDPATLDRLLPASEKRCYLPSAFAHARAVPLHHVYVLADGKPAVAHLTPGEALPELVRHSCGIRAIWHIGLQTRHFNQVTALLSAIDVRRLYRPRDLTSLDAVVRMVEEDVDHGRSNRLSGALSPRV